jgi:branched-subunit amino acid transport protein
MASGLEPAAPPPVTPLRASGRGEHWWPVALAIIVVAGLHVALPAKYRGNPPWVGPAVLLALLAALVIGDPGRIDQQKTWLRILTGTLIAFVTGANLFAAAHLVHDILTSNKLFASNATGLLATGGVIWVTNVIAFGLWYWDLDRGGAAARAHHPQANPAFVFPESVAGGGAGPDPLAADVTESGKNRGRALLRSGCRPGGGGRPGRFRCTRLVPLRGRVRGSAR